MAVSRQDELTTGTLDGLELRLRRLEDLLGNSTNGVPAEPQASRNDSVAARLDRLEASLAKLSSTSKPIAELLKLYKGYPELFPPTSAIPPSSSFSPQEQLATVNSCATSFSTTASQLTSVQDSPIPSAEASAALVALRPRLVAAEQRQTEQNDELGRLRLRTARALQRWYDTAVIGTNECWAEWDDRLMEAEKTVVVKEAAQEREKGPI